MELQWKYYNHAMLPTTPPHEDADMAPINDGTIWRNGGGTPLLARWTTDFDCGYETEWYYCIKDTPFILKDIKSSHRYDINKGRKYFTVGVIDPKAYIKDIYNVQVEAFRAYPEEYRPTVDYDKLEREIRTSWKSKTVFGAFEIESNQMVSYCIFEPHPTYIEWDVLKSIPQYERLKVNAAIIAYCLEYYNDDIKAGRYIHGGERNISHQTNFQDYLIRTFGFRRAYCKLHVAYRIPIGAIVKFLYPFRGILSHLHGNLAHNVNAILKMEGIIRNSG